MIGSTLNANEYIDYFTNPHTGRKDMVVRTSASSTLTLDANGNPYFGTTANHTLFEADGTLLMVGNATVYDDINIGMSVGKVDASNAPTWAVFLGNLRCYTFQVDNNIEIPPLEVLHDWEEGTALELHIHWATNGVNASTIKTVRWEIEYSWANMQSAGGTIVFTTPVAVAANATIAVGEASHTHKYTSVAAFTPAGGKIGMYLLMRVKRAATPVGANAPAVNPFGLAVGIHYQKDTLGSRSIAGK